MVRDIMALHGTHTHTTSFIGSGSHRTVLLPTLVFLTRSLTHLSHYRTHRTLQPPTTSTLAPTTTVP